MECGSLTTAATGSLDDLFSTQTTEVDVGMEWLSVLVEDCFSSRGNCLPAPIPEKPTTDSASKLEPNSNLSSVHQFAVSGKARSKRKRIAAAEGGRASSSTWSHPHPLAHDQYFPSSDPPLLDQAYWMADSELLPKKIPNQEREQEDEEEVEEQWLPGKGKKVIMVKNKMGSSEGVARRCSHCLSQRTPQWRAGPMGPKTLCNACGVRYKSGRLLPEYRPAKSPTFVSCLHSNSHRKVLEMRMGPGTGISSRRGGSGLGSSSGGGWGGGEVSTSIMAAENV